MLIEASNSKGINLSVQGVRLPVVGFECVQDCKCLFDFGVLKLPQTGEKRFFLVSGVLWSRFSKVAESGFESGSRLSGQRVVNELGNALQRSKKHLDAPMAIR
ncbi:MAG: hypothetical protein WAM79_17750 [Candidatus Sulfotelmatobacter sp.]